jgi:hypothetical protein
MVQSRIQHVADLMNGPVHKQMLHVSFDTDARGYVSGWVHDKELEPVLHLAEPFQAVTHHYEVDVAL